MLTLAKVTDLQLHGALEKVLDLKEFDSWTFDTGDGTILVNDTKAFFISIYLTPGFMTSVDF